MDPVVSMRGDGMDPVCACDAGLSCGLCLQLVPTQYCPRAAGYTTLKWHRTSPPAACAPGLGVSEMCIGEGQCGTDAGAHNCGIHSVYWTLSEPCAAVALPHAARVANATGMALPAGFSPTGELHLSTGFMPGLPPRNDVSAYAGEAIGGARLSFVLGAFVMLFCVIGAVGSISRRRRDGHWSDSTPHLALFAARPTGTVAAAAIPPADFRASPLSSIGALLAV